VGGELIGHFGPLPRHCENIAARNIDFVSEGERDRVPSTRGVSITIKRHDTFDRRFLSRRGHHDLISRCYRPGRHRACNPPKVQVGAVHPLDRKPKRLPIPIALHINGLKVIEQRGPLVPRRVFGPRDHVVAMARRKRDRGYRIEAQRLGELEIIRDNSIENIVREADEVYLVDSELM
jgi:hypothetical protein